MLKILGRAGLAPSRLQLEITESVLLEDSDTAKATLKALRKAGVHIALDDFGTGIRRSAICAATRSTS